MMRLKDKTMDVSQKLALVEARLKQISRDKKKTAEDLEHVAKRKKEFLFPADRRKQHAELSTLMQEREREHADAEAQKKALTEKLVALKQQSDTLLQQRSKLVTTAEEQRPTNSLSQRFVDAVLKGNQRGKRSRGQ